MAAFSSSALPTRADLDAARQRTVLDERGESVRFGDLIDGQRSIVIFIRHFFCGLCQDYLSYLSARLPVSLLEAHATRLVVIGCGSASLIAPYRQRLDCPFAVYADPNKEVYSALGMTRRTLEVGDKTPEYLKRGMLSNVVGSITSALSFGKIASPGDIKQVGGEFVLDEAGQPVWCHRMENTRDHAPLRELLAAAGIPYSGP